jgi:hypothetical protein
LGYGEDKVTDEADRGTADCASWLYHGLANDGVRKVEIVYPDWKGMVEWEKYQEESYLQPFLDRITAYTWSEWLQKGHRYLELKAAHICRSSNWTPPWLDQGFLELKESISGNNHTDQEWFNLDDEYDNPFDGPMIGGYDTLDVREFDWASVEADAKQVSEMIGQMGKKVAHKDEA